MATEMKDNAMGMGSEEKDIPSISDYKRTHYWWAILRIAIGLIFLWAFFDKLLGLGFTTCLTDSGIDYMCDSAWINGGSPTYGFLTFGTQGPFAGIYENLAGLAVVDWLFMLGLAGIGLTLTFGFLVRIGSLSGTLMMLLMYTAVLPPEHHPFLDDHIIYAIVLLGMALVHPCKYLGLGRWWSNLGFVKKYPIFE